MGPHWVIKTRQSRSPWYILAEKGEQTAARKCYKGSKGGGWMDAWNVEELMRRMQQEKERKRGQDFTVLLQSAADTAVHSPALFSLSPYAPVLGYGPRSAWVFYLYPVAQHPWGGFMTLSAGKRVVFTGKWMKSLLRELNHRNSYLPGRQPTTCRIMHINTVTYHLWKSSEIPISLSLVKTSKNICTPGAFG